LRHILQDRFDVGTGLYTTLQNAQDEYRKQQFSTYDNVLVWKAILEMARFATYSKDSKTADELTTRAMQLRKAIFENCVQEGGRGTSGPIFVSATDGKSPIFADVPPGSLFKLPALGFIPENDPLFVQTSDWLHSNNYVYSNSGLPYGLPGSYRVPFSTAWAVADHLSLKAGQQQALKVLRSSPWDGGIITEGVDPTSGVVDSAGRAFATAAGYVAHMICQNFCIAMPH
jgi:meiotically up-regulated gene 157 (Mug157) protein